MTLTRRLGLAAPAFALALLMSAPPVALADTVSFKHEKPATVVDTGTLALLPDVALADTVSFKHEKPATVVDTGTLA